VFRRLSRRRQFNALGFYRADRLPGPPPCFSRFIFSDFQGDLLLHASGPPAPPSPAALTLLSARTYNLDVFQGGPVRQIGIPELIIILGIAVLLFGGKKIPEVAKGLGEGIKNFKNALKSEEPKPEEKKQA
jgi:sec-independent protein translocase protein TatA